VSFISRATPAVARTQRGHHCAVLGQRLADATLLEQRVVAVQFHHLAQVVHDLLAPAVAGDLQQLEVKGLVGGEERVALFQLAFQAVVQRL
jgi:hypothetical protein